MSNPNRSPEAIRDELLQNVEYDFPPPPQLKWDPELGFLVDPAVGGGTGDVVCVAGFATPYRRKTNVPEYDPAHEVSPIDTFRDLPHSLRTMAHLNYGVGTRLYTDEPTARNGSDVQSGAATVGLYTMNLRRSKILDLRDKQGGPIQHVVRRAGRQALSIVLGTESAVGIVHHEYGDAAAVRLRRPLQGTLSMKHEGSAAPEEVEPGFLILRSRYPYLTRLGRVVSSDWL